MSDDIWKFDSSAPPDKVMEMAIRELRHPVNSIEGWAAILATRDFPEQHAEAVKWIQAWASGIRHVLDDLEAYLQNRKEQEQDRGLDTSGGNQ